jgi:hypothetical protein
VHYISQKVDDAFYVVVGSYGLVYIEDTWMTSTVWTVPTWSVFNQAIRTNNDVEGIINFL